uniref:Uncharacterized protein n=1 Tax=Meloidogyne enterolobii TaxID=390850 RepID=A0A6V7XI69_MELEN|nr:unnamed protein product [Meloidogyne enterolobii]
MKLFLLISPFILGLLFSPGIFAGCSHSSELSEEGQEEYGDTELATTSHGGNDRCNCGLYEVEELNKYIEIHSIGLHFKDETIGSGTFGNVKEFNLIEI